MNKKSHKHRCSECERSYVCWGRVCKEEHMQQRCDDCLKREIGKVNNIEWNY